MTSTDKLDPAALDAAEVVEQPVGDAKPEDAPPYYDPAVHTDPEQLVYVQVFCTCGDLLRQRDPVWAVLRLLPTWLSRHQGEDHGPASKADCVAERERRREAAHVVSGLAHEYAPREHPNLNTECTKDRPWPGYELVAEAARRSAAGEPLADSPATDETER